MTLLIVGGVAVRAVQHSRIKNARLLAAIPLIFGIQQCAEGIIWLVASHRLPSAVTIPASYIFLICAFIIWPVWIPAAVYALESNYYRRGIMRLCLAVGFCVSMIFLLYLVLSNVHAITHYKHIFYFLTPAYAVSAAIAESFESETIRLGLIGVYCCAVIVPLMISSVRLLHVFGMALIVSCIATYSAANTFFVSLWCFFAAALSIFVVYIVRHLPEGGRVASK